MPSDFDKIVDRRPTASVKWNLFDVDVLPMWVADMDFPAPPPILGALHGAVGHGVFGYDWPSQKMLGEVAGRMKRFYDWDLTHEDIVPIPGLVTGFNLAARIVCAPGEGILTQPPVYYPFLSAPENTDLKLQMAPLKTITHGRTLHNEIDWEVFDNAIHSEDARTGMFLLCSPHNPTGTIYSREELTRLAETCLRENIVICSDEIHSELLLDGNKHIPIATLSPEIAEQTITLVAASKTFNVAGLFVGFAIIQNEEMREKYKKEIQKLTLHTNGLGHIASEVAFSGACDEWLEELLDYLAANRDYLVDYVEKNLPGIRVSVPDATYLAWLDCNELISSGKIEGSPQEFFIEKGKVAFNEGATFGPGGEGFVRLNFGCPRETLIDGLERMKKALE